MAADPKINYDVPSEWSGTEFDDFFIINYAEQPSYFPLGRIKPVRHGADKARVPIFGALSAQPFTPGAGNELIGQASNQSHKDIPIDTFRHVSTWGDKWETIQSDVDYLMALAKQMSDAALADLNAAFKSILTGYTGHDATHEFSTAEGSEISSTNSAAIAAEILRLTTEAMIALDDETLGIGPNIGTRQILLDGWLYQHMAAGSDKQSPERTDQGFAVATGILNPTLGALNYNIGKTSRTAATYGGSDVSLVEFYVMTPDATAMGVQQYPTADAPQYFSNYKSTFYSADHGYGTAEGNVRAYTKCTVRLDALIPGAV